MFQTIFQLGPLSLKTFGLMAALGFVASYLAMKRIAEKTAELPSEDVSRLLVFTMVGGALGARLAYVAEHWSAEFAGLPFQEIFRFDKGGLMFYGGLVGAIAAIALFSSMTKRHIVSLLDLCATVLPLGHAFGRIGCFLNGCCYGRVTSSAFSVAYPAGSPAWHDQITCGLISRAAEKSLPLVPSQPIEAFLNLVLFVALFRIAQKTDRIGLLSGIYLVSYAIIRFFTETLRSDPRMNVGCLSIAQFICIFIALAGLLFIVFSRKKRCAA